MSKQIRKINAKRYRLHQHLKRKGIKYHPRMRLVFWRQDKMINEPAVKALQDNHNYKIQTVFL